MRNALFCLASLWIYECGRGWHSSFTLMVISNANKMTTFSEGRFSMLGMAQTEKAKLPHSQSLNVKETCRRILDSGVVQNGFKSG